MDFLEHNAKDVLEDYAKDVLEEYAKDVIELGHNEDFIPAGAGAF